MDCIVFLLVVFIVLALTCGDDDEGGVA